MKSGKEESLKRFHPWIFSGAIARVENEPEEGEVVDVYTSEALQYGYFRLYKNRLTVLFGYVNCRVHGRYVRLWD